MARLIFHVDVNSAFLSWEAVRRVRRGEDDLRWIPSCIGGDPQTRRGVVLAKSIPAKAFGVKTGEPLAAALRKCPSLVIAPPDFGLYSACSKAFKDICRSYAPIEEFSIDECFLDLTGTERLYPDPLALARELKDRIRDELGFTVNVGVAANKLCAKMASDFEKPDRVHTLFPDEIPRKLWPLPVQALLFVGGATAARLERAGIRTVGELARSDPRLLNRLLGEKQGAQTRAFANGIDDSPVREQPEDPKGYSNSVTLEEDVTTAEAAHTILLALSDSVTQHMRRDGAKAFGVAVTIRYLNFQTRSHQRRLDLPTDSTRTVYETAKSLLDELWRDRRPLRLMGVSLGGLTKEPVPEQLALFDDGEQAGRRKAEALDRAVDAVRDRFGFGAIQRGAVMSSRLDVARKFKGTHEAEREAEAGDPESELPF